MAMNKNSQGMMGKSSARGKTNSEIGKKQSSASKSNGNLPKKNKKPMPPPYKPIKKGK